MGLSNHNNHFKTGLLFKDNRKKVRRMMRDMGIYALYPKPNLSKRYHAQYVRPYLLRNLEISRPNQVWVLISLISECLKALCICLSSLIGIAGTSWITNYRAPLINPLFKTVLKGRCQSINRRLLISDQGSHFTNQSYIDLLEEAGVKISMDGKGQCLDNAITERFFRSLKYDRIYVYEYETPRELRTMVNEYIKT